jgi:Ca2+-binding RTX toxin-like protein
LTGLQIGSLFDVSTPGGGYIYLNGDLEDVSLHRRDQNLVLAYSGDVQDWVMQSHLDSMGVLYSLVPGSTVGLAATSALVVYNWYDRPQGSYLSTIRDFWSNSSDPESIVDLYSTAWNIGFDLVGTGGADHLVGTAVNDTLSGLGGNDILEGGAGNDVYRIDASSAEDTIVDSSGADRIEISGSSTAVEFHDTEAGLEAVIGNPTDGNRIVVQDWFTNPDNRIESWAFAGDAITLTADQVEAQIVGNRAPVLVAPIPDSVAAAGTAFTYQVPQGTFVDPNPGDTLNYGATLENGQPLPGWMIFDGATRTLSGTRPATDTGLYSVQISATDGSGRTASDTLTIFARPNQQVGTESADTLNGTAADDVLEGYGGADVLSGADGQDELQGGAGHDRLDGGSGNDLLLGGSGEDRITGSAGDDRLEGGDGADTYLFDAEFGNDTVIDSLGRSRIEFTEASGLKYQTWTSLVTLTTWSSRTG